MVWGKRGVTVDTASMVTRSSEPVWRRANSMLVRMRAAPPSEVAQISSRRKRVGHHGGGQDLVGGDHLPVAGVHVLQPVPGVLDLDRGEVRLGGAEQLHPPAGVEGEVGRVGGPEQMEAQPVGVVLPVPAHRGEEALRGGVGPDHQGDVAQAGEDLGPGVADGLGPRGAGGVGRGDPGPGPPEGLGEGGAGHEAGVAVADGVGPGHELDIGPGQTGLLQGVARRGQAVLDEVAAPLPPRVHARAQHGDALVVRHWRPPSHRWRRAAATSTPRTRGRRPHTGCRAPARTSVPTDRSGTPTPATTWPITTSLSAASSTAAMAKGT